VEKVIEDNLPSVEIAFTDLKIAWSESILAEEKIIKILNKYI
jgi:type I restriction enzyme M protein